MDRGLIKIHSLKIAKYPILYSRINKIDFTDEQIKVLCDIQDFLKIEGYKAFLLNGNSGTGKTTIAENIIRYSRAMILAPTNAALQRLRDKITDYDKDRFKTLHSLLYGEPDVDGNFTVSANIEVAGVYIVDEASMIDKKLLDDLISHAKQYKSKLIFLGDDFQLEPVGEDPKLFVNKDNMYFDANHVFKIENVRRSRGDILKVATHLRTHKNGEILNINSEEFKVVPNIQNYIDCAIESGEDHIILVATNNTRVRTNAYVRMKLYPFVHTDVLNENEKVISVANNQFVNCELYTINNPVLLESFVDHEVNIGTKLYPKMKKYSFYLYEHETEGYGDRKFRTLVIPNLDLPSLHGGQLLLNDIFQNEKYREFNPFTGRPTWIKGVNIATYGYAISCNKS
jgi:tRNA A37 threonylcarbamoyladenosine biosynthesis protein TsaE